MAKTDEARIERAAEQIQFYNACVKGYTEPLNVQLPSSNAGHKARNKAMAEGRLKTYRQGNPLEPALIKDLEDRIAVLKGKKA